MDVVFAMFVFVVCTLLADIIDDKYGITFSILTVITAISIFLWLLIRYNI